MAEAAQDSGCFCRKSSKIGNDPHRVKWCVLNNMTADIKHKETLPAWERFAVQWIRLTGRGIPFRETVTCVPNRIGRWVFANSRRSVAASILRRLFWYKVSVFLFAPGEFRKPLISWLFRHLSHDCFSATIKTKPAVAFWQAFSAVLLIFAKVIVCEIFAKGGFPLQTDYCSGNRSECIP